MSPQVDRQTGLEIDTCPECAGPWFDGKEMARFLQGGTLKIQVLRVAEVEPLQSVGYSISTRARACPRCRAGMEERTFSDVTVDVCPTCQGIFLDDGELRRIILKYEKGERGDQMVREQLDKGYGRNSPSAHPVMAPLVAFFRRFTKQA